MKIGILTYHRAENYGALLQAYALKTYLQSLGLEVSFVDYWPSYHAHADYYSLFSWRQFVRKSFKGKAVMLLYSVLWLLPKTVRKIRLRRFMHNSLGLQNKPLYTESTVKTEKYDVVVYGSDQIWRKQNLGGVSFDSWYFGSDNVVADKKIVYAGSMGEVKTDTEDDLFIKKMMSNFDAISVREQDLHLYLDGLGVSSSVVIDPVFLLSSGQWRRLAVKPDKKGKYILFYNLINTGESVHFAEKLSSETNLPIVEINIKQSIRRLGKRYVSTASVPEFLGLIDGAEYVVSNSFHGVAFSIIFEKRFFAVGMRNRANRVCSLLSLLGLESCYVNESSQDVAWHFENVKGKLNESVLYSESFLKQSF
ncbi:MAG: polysaccharide pyruvyl transferase family protein [Bacteroidaceae bacterium]|nr:polysaccharide pyruvyl transferase family protein [Bacteroidaceae bacterium]